MDYIKCLICEANGDSYFVLNEEDLKLHQQQVHGIGQDSGIKVEPQPEPARPDIPRPNAIDSLKVLYKIEFLKRVIEELEKEVGKETELPRKSSSYNTSEQEKYDNLVGQRQEFMEQK